MELDGIGAPAVGTTHSDCAIVEVSDFNELDVKSISGQMKNMQNPLIERVQHHIVVRAYEGIDGHRAPLGSLGWCAWRQPRPQVASR